MDAINLAGVPPKSLGRGVRRESLPVRASCFTEYGEVGLGGSSSLKFLNRFCACWARHESIYEMAEQAQEKSSFDKLIEKPKFNFWMGIVLAGLGLVGGWWLTRATVEPRYKVLPSETLARKESPRLSVTWDGRQIQTLCVASVIVMNKGTTPLGGGSFSTVDPVRISAVNLQRNQEFKTIEDVERVVEILSAEITHASRPNLVVDWSISKDKREVPFQIRGGDAFDTNDGVSFRILFSGSCRLTSFEVVGRVIGSTSGFTSIPSDLSFDANSGRFSIGLKRLIITLLLLPIAAFLVAFAAPDRGITIHMRSFVVSFVLWFLLMQVYSLYEQVFDPYNVKWLP
jgi:hypothetical protein